MSKGKKGKRKSAVNWRKFLNRLAMVVLLLSAAIYVVYIFIKPASEMVQLTYATVGLKTDHEAVVLRDELVVSTNNPGIFKPIAKDGQVVNRNDIVGIFEVLDRAEIPISEIIPQAGATNVLVDRSVLEGEAQAIYEAFVDALRNKQYAVAQNTKRELEFKLERLKKLEQESSENAFHLQVQRSAMVGENAAAVGSQLTIAAVESGTISLTFDGLEDTMAYQNRYQIDFSQIFGKEVPIRDHIETPVANNTPLFKVVNTQRWYLACLINLDDFDLFDREDKVGIAIGTERIEGRVQETFANGQLGILILRIEQPIVGGHAIRVANVSLVRDEVKGLVVPKTALVERGGQIGIYTVDTTKRIIFKPVHLIAEKDAQSVVVHEGQFTVVDAKGDQQQVLTVQHGERILKNPQGKREGDQINQ